MNAGKKIISSSLALCVMLCAALSCGKEKASAPEISAGTVVFVSGEAFINDIAAKTGDRTKQGDRFSTKDRSALTVQFGGSALLVMGENAQLSIESLAAGSGGKQLITLFQKKGSTFNKIRKGAADYSVRSSTMTAAVRGTSFTVTASDTAAEVKLLEGAVHLTAANAGADLAAGSAILSDGKGLSPARALTKEEISGLEKLDAIELQAVSPGRDVAPYAVPADALTALGRIEAAKEPAKKMTLDDIRRTMGPLSTIKTKSGKSYVGAFVQKGTEMEITTADGVFRVPSADIQNVTPYK